ncbi:MAG: NAD-dependent epimerase/dehydratase family protein, partial [Deltaproteobacteria bacterium]|nr:NAD-dependent epimerase/dehydratase family protein [Deltaproteobacteria bacterium]
AGFIASHIVDAYVADGHEVVVIDNMSTGKEENKNPKAKYYTMDICDPKITDIFESEKPEILSHHAAQIDVRTSVADPQFDIKVNLGGFVNLLEAGRKNGLKKVILASSGGTVYGEQNVFPATEDHPTRPICPYGLNKLGSEQYLYFYEKEYGLKWVALRYANIYGPRQNPHGEAGVVAIFIKKMLAGEQPVINGDGKQTRDYVFVSDVVEANRLALKDNAYGPYNVGTGVETDVNAIFRALREFTDSTCDEQHVPAKSGEQARCSIEAVRMKNEFNWNTTVEFADGMKRMAEWFVSGNR